ncbi:hypothetical protein NDU88_001034 [Pleurodeles waltl]|uniref:Uncharacterized protein n=1 Tax=Pleurodeles waltl TaxID=8319 RepID=A0AAV7SBS0_PLEWA|nr:hypothetical protein NDU88_001034 [Pleurodeles waltl]
MLGTMSFCIPLIPNCHFRIRPLQEQLATIWIQAQGSFEDTIFITKKMKAAKSWWIRTRTLSQGLSFFPLTPQVIMMTNASLDGCSAHLQDLMLHGKWSSKEAPLYINHFRSQSGYSDQRQNKQKDEWRSIKLRYLQPNSPEEVRTPAELKDSWTRDKDVKKEH